MSNADPTSASSAELSDAARGPRVVALGGGHGLAASLRAARSYAGAIAGVVSVADDGGSSGKIRRDLGLPAPGDVRRCLSALAGNDSLLARSLEHRFDAGDLEGHPIGNLLIAGLANATGDFEAAIAEVARLVGAHGHLYPATLGSVTLLADSDSGPLRGQVTIERATNIRNLRFEPPDPRAPEAAVRAILDADQVIIGPGSLFTSVLAVA
ncbi:MAG: uridine diphosphate-N-acetylglucosamine-binding protein YvcK, partial [Acidimicrobiales bacterium]